jgi:hypothetical protein
MRFIRESRFKQQTDRSENIRKASYTEYYEKKSNGNQVYFVAVLISVAIYLVFIFKVKK